MYKWDNIQSSDFFLLFYVLWQLGEPSYEEFWQNTHR